MKKLIELEPTKRSNFHNSLGEVFLFGLCMNPDYLNKIGIFGDNLSDLSIITLKPIFIFWRRSQPQGEGKSRKLHRKF